MIHYEGLINNSENSYLPPFSSYERWQEGFTNHNLYHSKKQFNDGLFYIMKKMVDVLTYCDSISSDFLWSTTTTRKSTTNSPFSRNMHSKSSYFHQKNLKKKNKLFDITKKNPNPRLVYVYPKNPSGWTSVAPKKDIFTMAHSTPLLILVTIIGRLFSKTRYSTRTAPRRSLSVSPSAFHQFFVAKTHGPVG